MLQQAGKQLETELETILHSLMTFAVCVQLFWSVYNCLINLVQSII